MSIQRKFLTLLAWKLQILVYHERAYKITPLLLVNLLSIFELKIYPRNATKCTMAIIAIISINTQQLDIYFYSLWQCDRQKFYQVCQGHVMYLTVCSDLLGGSRDSSVIVWLVGFHYTVHITPLVLQRLSCLVQSHANTITINILKTQTSKSKT